MTSLTAHQVQQLVSLRLALEDALGRARGASKYRRGASIAALDATVERASTIVAITRGVVIPTNGKLDDLISRLVQDLGTSWRPAVLPDIKHLRRARNASQHEGLEPDRDQVPLWASAADTYVSSIIMAQFDVGIHQVVLSDAIRDDGLREFLRLSEEARDADHCQLSVHHSAEAYREALNRWKRLHSRSRHRFAPSHREIQDRKSFEYLDTHIKDMQTVLDTVAFSPDAAEAEWFASAISERGDVLNAEDAERALAFSFEWIVEYERAADSWTPNRRHRAAMAARMVRSGEGPAYIESCIGVELQYDRVQAKFRIGDVPDEKGYPSWSHTLQEILPERREGLFWTVLDDGTVTVSKALEGATDFSSEVASLDDALKRTDSRVKDKLADAEAKEQAHNQKRTAFADAITTIQEDLPSWVTEVTLEIDGFRANQDEIRLTLEESVSNIRFGDRTPNSFHDDRRGLRDAIIEHESVAQCYGIAQQNQLAITPALDSQDLLQVLKAADETVRKQLEIDQHRQDENGILVVSARKSIAATLAAL